MPHRGQGKELVVCYQRCGTALPPHTLSARRRQRDNMLGSHMSESTRIESSGPLELMGVAVYGNPAHVSFHDAWVHFGRVADEFAISRFGKDLYGLQIYPPTFPAIFEFTYMACMEKTAGIDVPIRMLMKSVPRCSYVVQKVVGGVRGIDQALQYIHKEYIPQNALRVAMPFDFEKYCNVESDDRFEGQIEVWVPIARYVRTSAASI